MAVIAAMFVAGCGGEPKDAGPGADSDAAPGMDSGSTIPDAGGGPSLSDLEFETSQGCAGVYNPDQVLDYYIDIAPGDWSALLADQSNSIYFSAEFRCGDEPAITVGVRRKRSGGTSKTGLKIDFNAIVPGQAYYGLRKFSLENGVSEGSTEDSTPISDYLAEYLSWRMMVRSSLVTGRAVFARIFVNDALVGVYVNVEQVDKRFLAHRLGDSTGWLYKKSGSAGDGPRTHENDGLSNPYEDYFCFWGTGGTSCPVPTAQELAQDLPARLDIDQLLRYGAVNAIIANADSLLFKDNNYYYYDWAGGRTYLPWDLDTVMKENFDVFTGGGGNGSVYTDVLYSNWEGDYDAIVTELLAGPLSLEAIDSELARAEAVAADAFATDPYVSETMADAVSSLQAYWTQRHAAVQAMVDAH